MSKLIGERPPLSMESREQLRDIMDKLNEEALIELIPMDALRLVIDRAWCALFPEKVSQVKRKKYQRIPF